MNTGKPSNNIHTESVQRIWKWLSSVIPSLSTHDYREKHVKYIQQVLEYGHNPHFGSKLISPDERQTIPDNSAHFENISYKYNGLTRIKLITDKKIPVAFISWHHGALHHASYAIARVLPQVAVFSFWSYQLGKVFAYPMEGHGALSLVRMGRFLNDGRPILYYFDGLPLGKCITLKTLGVDARLSTAPINIIRMVENVRIVPVTSYYKKENEEDIVNTIFHEPLPDPAILAQMTDSEVLTSLIAHFEKDLCEKAPEQILMSFFVSRELNAQKTKKNSPNK